MVFDLPGDYLGSSSAFHLAADAALQSMAGLATRQVLLCICC